MTCPMQALSAEEIREQMISLPGWQVNDNALERVYQAPSYLEGLEKLNAIAQLSERENHHPDLLLSWRKLMVRYWTHTAHGITSLDFKLARQAEAIIAAS